MTRTNGSNARAARGFTLLELVIVLVLIGSLLAMVGPRIFANLGRANSEKAKIQMEQIGGALELYKLDNGRYPTTSEGLDSLLKANSGATNWNGPYIKNPAQLKDAWQRDFKYVSPGEKGGYDLISFGADGKEGGDGENKDIRN